MYQHNDDLISNSPTHYPIDYYIFPSGQAPKAILHYVHGMSEHALRYKPMGEWFAKKGIVFVCHDQVGHGPAARSRGELGYFGNIDSQTVMVDDLHQVIQKVKRRYPHLPYIILGHSMGSYVTRLFLKKYSTEIDGVILSGTSAHEYWISFGRLAQPILDPLDPKATNYFLHRALFGGLGVKQIKQRNEYQERIYRYWYPHPDENIIPPLDGFAFTNDGFSHLIRLAYAATSKSWSRGIRKNLPFFVMHGALDPMISPFTFQRNLYEDFKSANFQNVRFELYQGRGHELFLYDHEEVVYQDILTWISNLSYVLENNLPYPFTFFH